jgi:O-antigen/teichoic acid export membrane protein
VRKRDPATSDEDWYARERPNETPSERLDRNWTEMLQELRVVQTGVQLLTGFLLTLPFQQRFSMLSEAARGVYLSAVSASILATGFLQAPVSLHRALFRKHRRAETVQLAHRLAIVGIVCLACAVVLVTTLIFQVLLGWTGGVVAGVLAFLLLLGLWLVTPWRVRTRSPQVSEPTHGTPESGRVSSPR